MLRRFADARLRRDLDKALNARDQARDTARRLFRRLQAARADNAAIRAELAAERARTQETQPPAHEEGCACFPCVMGR